jgi:hypothetical protein
MIIGLPSSVRDGLAVCVFTMNLKAYENFVQVVGFALVGALLRTEVYDPVTTSEVHSRGNGLKTAGGIATGDDAHGCFLSVVENDFRDRTQTKLIHDLSLRLGGTPAGLRLAPPSVAALG